MLNEEPKRIIREAAWRKTNSGQILAVMNQVVIELDNGNTLVAFLMTKLFQNTLAGLPVCLELQF